MFLIKKKTKKREKREREREREREKEREREEKYCFIINDIISTFLSFLKIEISTFLKIKII